MGSALIPHKFWVIVVVYNEYYLWKLGDKYRFTSKQSPLPPMDSIGTTDLNWLCYLIGVEPPQGV